jgi:hypothetical protein
VKHDKCVYHGCAAHQVDYPGTHLQASNAANLQENQNTDTVTFTKLEVFGIKALDYSVTCKSLPRAVLMSSTLDDYLAAADPVALADSLMPPPAQVDGRLPLGRHSEVILVAACIGMVPVSHMCSTAHLHGRSQQRVRYQRS